MEITLNSEFIWCYSIDYLFIQLTCMRTYTIDDSSQQRVHLLSFEANEENCVSTLQT